MKRLIKNRRRRGIASLELVLGLPFILAIAAAVFVVGFAGIKRTATVIESRHASWQQRSTPDKNGALYILAAADSGKVEGEASSTARAYQWMGGDRQIQAKSVVLTGTWDHKQLEDFEKTPNVPHVLTALRIASDNPLLGSAIQATGQGLALLAPLLGGGGILPNQGEIDEANDMADGAQEEGRRNEEEAEAEKKKETDKVDAKIDELTEEKRGLEAQQRELTQQRQENENQRRAKQTELSDARARQEELNRQADELGNRNPPEEVPGSLQSQIDSQEDTIDRIEDEISSLDQQINNQTREINRLGNEISAINEDIAEHQRILREIENPPIDELN